MIDNTSKLINKVVSKWIPKGARVLDLGCGEGDLMSLLMNENKANVQGIEIDEESIYKCVAKGLSVFHGDLDVGLSEYPDDSFDYVLLINSLQEVMHPDTVLKESFRVAENVIVSFPNFAFIKARIRMFFTGKVPITRSLPYQWYDTPNLHFLSIKDFEDYCRKRNYTIVHSSFVTRNIRISILPNLFALNGIFHIARKGDVV